MIIADLFIKNDAGTWVECDKYEEASIYLRDKIKDAQDIGKVFTEFTQQFRLPASKTNNKLFNHYYSVNVLEGFDARRKYDALIKLNGVDYKKGYIKLNGVDLRDEKPHAYRVQFYGELTSLKDKIGEDMLEDLKWLDRYNHAYSMTNVLAGFETSLKYTAGSGMAQGVGGEIIYPFITHTRGFTYSTSSGMHDINGSAIAADRLNYTDLKPALKVSKIFEAIEQEYGISFSGSFIDGTAKYSPLQDLWLWLHREKGNFKNNAEDDDQVDFYATLEDGNGENEYTLSSGTDFRIIQTEGGLADPYNEYDIDFNVTTGDSGDYTIRIEAIPQNNNYNPVVDEVYVTDGNGTASVFLQTPSGSQPTRWYIYTYVWAENTISTITPKVTVTQNTYSISGDSTDTGIYGNTSVSTVKNVNISNNMPKMKVIDFLTSIFKMFNLVAYTQPQSNLTDSYDIVLEPYQEFLDAGVARDITPYVDISESSVDRVAPYNVIRFEYPEPKTFLAIKSTEINKKQFGNEVLDTYNLSGTDDTYLYDGGAYEVKVDFEKMQFARMLDTDDNSVSEFQWGWSVNDFSENTQEGVVGNPLVFFNINRELTTDTITWNDGTVTGNGTTNADFYNAPSNVNSDGTYTLNFGAEFDEWTAATNDGSPNENSLFAKFYETYITNIYHRETRRKKVNAVLPAKFIYNYKLNDKVVINREPYNIESIEINLLDGRSKLELLKINGFEETYNKQSSFCYAIDYVTEPYWCQGFVDLTDPTKPTLPNGLVSYYRFENIGTTDFTSLTDVIDSVGTNHGTHSAAVYPNLVTGVNGQGLDYSNDSTIIPADASLTFIDVPFSVSGYFNFDSIGSTRVLLSKQDTDGASNYEWRIEKNSSHEIVVYLYTDASNYISIKSTTTLSADTWYHIVVTHDGSDNESGLNIYINGSLETPQSNSLGTYTGMVDNSLTLDLGYKEDSVSNDYFDGIMDGLGIWNVELNASNVSTIYELQQNNELI